MEIRFSDSRHLMPKLLDASGASPRRVAGVLAVEPGADGVTRSWCFVDALEHDGLGCRYRVSDGVPGTPRWIPETDANAYRAFSHLVIERLRRTGDGTEPDLHRFPGGPPSRTLGRRLRRLPPARTLTVRDTAVTPDGRLWLRAELRSGAAPERLAFAGASSGRRRTASPVPAATGGARHPDPVDGWLLLADVTAASDGRAGPVADVAPSGRAVA